MKKTIKIFLILAISICMIFLVTGCGNKEVVKEGNKNASSEEITKEEVKKKEFSMGEWKDGVYTNDFIGLTVTEPDGWTHLSDEEIAESMNIAKDLLNDNQKAALEISKLNSANFAVINNTENGDNIRILGEKNTLSLSAEKYLSAVKTGLEELESMDYEAGEITDGKIGNNACKVLSLKGTYSGVTFAQKYYTYEVEGYFISVIATSAAGEDSITSMISNIK